MSGAATGGLTAAALPAAMVSIFNEVAGDGATRQELWDASAQVIALAPDEAGSFVVRMGAGIIKVHAADVEEAGLRRRLAMAASLPDVFLLPSQPEPTRSHDRLVTFWPLGQAVDPDAPDDVPWTGAAQLLARLHVEPPPPDLPTHGFPASVADSVARLRATSDAALRAAEVPAWGRAAVVAAAGAIAGQIWDGQIRDGLVLDGLVWDGPVWDGTDRDGRVRSLSGSGRRASIVHGDFHLGQLVRVDPRSSPAVGQPRSENGGAWRLIDVDALGIGDPAWDLARPAMWFLAGVVSPDDWHDFLLAYADGGGRGVPPEDPWPALEPFARAAAVQGAASALARAGRTGHALDEIAMAFLEACRRIADM